MGRTASAILALTVVLTGCGTSSGSPGATTSGEQTGDRISVAQVYEGIEFYPACGNETVELEGTTWYQLLPEEQINVNKSLYRSDITDSTAHLLGAPLSDLVLALGAGGRGMPAASRFGLPAVPNPGKGDDVGTVTVFADGMGYFESDSGDLSTWLTTDERNYGWVC